MFPTTRPLTADKEDQLEAAKKCHDEYDQREAIIRVQIFTTIPDSLLIEVQKLKEVWDALCAKNEKKALTVMVDICCRMYKMKCEDESQVCMHLETLTRIQEQLTGMGVGLPDTDLITVIHGSLPKLH